MALCFVWDLGCASALMMWGWQGLVLGLGRTCERLFFVHPPLPGAAALAASEASTRAQVPLLPNLEDRPPLREPLSL